MKKKFVVMMVIFFGIIFTACQDNDQQPEQDSLSDTGELNLNDATDESSSDSRDDHSAARNEDLNEEDDESAISGTSKQEADVVMEENYSTVEEAVDAIENYREIEQTNVDLGHGIKGFVEGAAGHHYISWNEGKWLIVVDFPSNPEHAIDNYEDGESMAKSIVDYLEDHYLPPPDERGLIRINGSREYPETVIRWQQGNTVYEINQKTAYPLEALQLAVDYNQR